VTAEAVALAMAMPEAVASDELSVEQNQTKALSCPAVVLQSDRKTTHANGKRDALFFARARTTDRDALRLRKGAN